MNSLLLIITISLSLSCCDENHSSLKLIHVFFRHGSRIPDKHELQPDDEHFQYFENQGFGQLTKQGKKGAYELGKVLHNRYHKFLGETYNPSMVYTQSTDYDRTKMSALLLLAGLFPPSPSEMFSEDLNWIPIPYNYEKFSNDYELRRPTFYCPTYTTELKRVLESEEMQKFMKTNKQILEYISKHMRANISTLQDVIYVFQTLTAKQHLNISLPIWTERVHPKLTDYLSSMLCAFESSNTLLKTLNGGRMLKKVIENMIKKSQGSLEPRNRKIFLYSAHDVNVINILATLDLYKPRFPKYSSATIIELHYHNETAQYAVKIFYVDDPHSTPEELFIGECGEFCELNKFIDIAKPHLAENFTEACESNIFLN